MRDMLTRFALALEAALAKITKLTRLTKLKKNIKPVKNAADENLSGGEPLPSEIGRLWDWVLPAALGLTAGWFCAACLGVWLEGVSARPLSAESYAAAPQDTGQGGMTVFLRANPFKVTPMPAPPGYGAPPPVTGSPVTGSLAGAVLKGTSPGYIAWMEDQGQLKLVMQGSSFDVYTLEEVTYTSAVFVNGEQRVVKEIVYGGGPAAFQPGASVPDAPAFAGQVAPPAQSGGAPGVIDRNVINQLLENPFDELKKVRIRPVPEGQGLRVEWITQDSILAQLGVRENDVVQAVNGIVFRNAMDVSNSLNSLIASDQFIVDVVRGGTPATLAYEVR